MVREHNERAWLAYHIAALPRAKKFPKIEAMMIKGDARRRRIRQTPEQMMAICRMMAATSFPPIRKVN